MNSISKTQINEDVDEVLMALVYVDNLKEMQNFSSDLLTDKELTTIAARWKAVRMLKAGIVYSRVAKATGMSSATIARLAKLLRKRAGGFSSMLVQMGA